MTYGEALEYIASLQNRGWRLGLDRMTAFLERIGNPHLGGTKFIHVAGTNGKGSVTAMVQAALIVAGHKTGGFFSPYVYDFRERIQLNGELIPEKDVARITERLKPIAEELGVTEFEFKTAMGFLFWKEMGAEWVALEVGLGGRLDCTNLVIPEVAVITEIGLDHQQFLGNTLREIASEKAGIMKPGIPTVTGVTNPESLSAIEEKGGEIWRLGKEILLKGNEIETPIAKYLGLSVSLLGEFQRRNMAVAVAALDAAGLRIPDSVLSKAFQNLKVPGRMEVISESPKVILDGAHNAQAAKAIAETIGQCRVIYSAATGHNPKETIGSLAVFAKKLYICQMKYERGLSLDSIQEVASGNWEAYGSVREAIAAALEEMEPNETLLVTGSFYLLPEAKAEIATLLNNQA